MKKLFFIILFLLFPLNLEAKNDEFLIECDKVSFKEFEDFACRTKINSSFNYDKITFEIDTTNGLYLQDTRTNYTILWDVSNKKNIITAKTKNNQLVNGFQEFGIILMSISECGNQKLNIKNIVLTNTKEKETLNLEDTDINIKIESSENKLKEIKVDGKKISKFSPSSFNYYFESSAETINIEAKPVDENSKIIGVGEIKLDSNVRETIIPITVTSENGINRIYKLYIINNNISEKDIKASLIEILDENGNKLDINFSDNIYDYNLELNPNIKKISIKSSLENKDYSFVKGYDNQTININNGDNLVLVKVKAATGDIKTYTINITKLLSNKSSNAYLKKIIIEDYDLKFNKKVKLYNLIIKKSNKSLKINAMPEDNKATVNIVGNEDLKDGSIIKIIVKAENESKITYQLHITNIENSYIPYILLIIIISIMVLIYIKYKKLINKAVLDYINNKKNIKNIKNKRVIEVKDKKTNGKKSNSKITNKKAVSKEKIKNDTKSNIKSVQKKSSKKSASKSQTKTTVSATKKKPINKKTKKKIAKNKKQNKKQRTKK